MSDRICLGVGIKEQSSFHFPLQQRWQRVRQPFPGHGLLPLPTPPESAPTPSRVGVLEPEEREGL